MRPTHAGRTVGRASDGLVFVRVEAGSTDIARARLADGAVESVTRTPGRAETWPYWSGAARRVVFQVAGRPEPTGDGRTAALPPSDLVLWDPETGTETALLKTPIRDERWPAWSPDGRFLVYAFVGGRPAAGVARLELASEAVLLLATASSKAVLLRPSFAPSGRRFSLEQWGEDGRGSQLRILPIAPGSQLRAVTSDADSIDTKGFFARNGEELLFTRQPARLGGLSHQRRIYRVAAAGGDARPVFESAESAVAGPRSNPSDLNELDEHSAQPSPTRDEFAFVSNRDSRGGGNDSDLFLAALDGSNVRRITHTPNWSEFAPRWSPNGERIVVIATPVELGQPRLVEPSDLAQIRLRVFNREGDLLFDEFGMMADWMPPWP